MPRDSWKAIDATRAKLMAYIDALWAARLAAPDSLKSIYTERLAMAARFSSLLASLRSVAELQDLVRRENGAFPRALLEHEPGRQARSAFNLLAREVAALQEFRVADDSIPTGPESLVGEQLSSVEFVIDYVQLHFNGHSFQVFCPVELKGAFGTIGGDGPGFRDALCRAIGRSVRSVTMGERAVRLAFDDLELALFFADAGGKVVEPLVFTNRDSLVSIYAGQQ
jgi:hypothetical protein